MKKYFILFILTLCSLQSFSQGVPAFNRYPDPLFNYFDGNSTSDVIQLQNSDLLLTGSVHNYPALIKTDLNGVRKWAKVLYTSGYTFNLGQIILYDASTVYMLGNISSSQYGAILIKADTSGNIIWSKRIFKINQTAAITMLKTYDNKFLVFASDTSGSVLVKIDTSGNQVWSKRYYTTITMTPFGAYPYGGYAYDGPGNIVELPDHSITMAVTTLQSYLSYVSTGFTSATIIKTDTLGNITWAKKLQPTPPPVMFFPSGPVLTGVGDIFYASDHNYILTMNGNYTMKIDSNGNAINGNSFSANHPLKVISESPQGTINIVEDGGPCCGDVIIFNDNIVFFQADINFNSVTAKQEKDPDYYTTNDNAYLYTGNVRQLSDKRFVFTGGTGNYGTYNRGGIILITDSVGNQSCISHTYATSLSFDSGLHTTTATIYSDTGISLTSITVNDSLLPIPHCNCDSLPHARFGVSISGLTVTCHDSSQNVLSYYWDFGDGGTSALQNPVHTYTTSINHTITLQASNNCGSDNYSFQLYPSYYYDSVKGACNGLCNGSARAKVSGGTPPYTYSWNTSPVQTTATATNLCPGIYHVTVTDANNISSAINNITIVADTVHATISQHTNITCNGYSNGSATVSVSSGVSPYSFIWNNNPPVSSNIVNTLSAGTNIVTVLDGDYCSTIDTLIITQPAPITISRTIHNPCNGNSNGHITTAVSGGTAPYTYMWNNNSSLNQSHIDSLSAGTYTLLVKDSNLCTATDTEVLIQSGLIITASIQNVSCYNNNTGHISVSVSGGTQPYSFSWNTSPPQYTSSLSNLYSGIYYLVCADSFNCLAYDTITITQPPSALSDSTHVVNVGCHGDSSGYVVIFPYGGHSPYTLLWNTSPSQTGDTAYSLSAGTYTVQVTDSLACLHTDTVHITQPYALLINITQTPDSGTCVGTATAIVTGGTQPYHYLWSNSATTPSISSLCGNMQYTLQVQDSNNCTAIDSVTIIDTTTRISNVTTTTNISIVPNPFKENILIDWSRSAIKPAAILVTNTSGATLVKIAVETGKVLEKNITTASWPPGFYIITITDSETHTIARLKLVKE